MVQCVELLPDPGVEVGEVGVDPWGSGRRSGREKVQCFYGERSVYAHFAHQFRNTYGNRDLVRR